MASIGKKRPRHSGRAAHAARPSRARKLGCHEALWKSALNAAHVRRWLVRRIAGDLAILSGLLATIVALGLAIGLMEGWSVQESIYFSFVTGLTIGYGDFAPQTFATRALAIVIGICGVLVTALVAAVAVKALSGVSAQEKNRDD